MSAAKAIRVVQAMPERPYDSVAEAHLRHPAENVVNDEVERRDNAVTDVISNLPTDAPSRLRCSDDARQDGLMVFDEILRLPFVFV